MNKIKSGFEIFRKKAYEEFKSNMPVYIGIIFAVFSLFYCIKYIVCGSMDDINIYVGYKIGLGLSGIPDFAKSQGRIFSYITAPVGAVPFLFDSWVWYKFTSFLGLLFSAAMLCMLLYRHVNKESALLAVLLFFSLAQLDGQHNVLICYIFTHQINIGFAILAVERYLTWIKTKKKYAMATCCFAWLFASMLYECYLLTFGIFVLICIFYHIKDKHFEFKAALMDILAPLICVVSFAVTYFGYRAIHPSRNAGAVIDNNIDILQTIKTMLILSFGKFPGFTSYCTLQGISLSEFVNNIDLLILLNSFLVTISFGVLVYRQKSEMIVKSTAITILISFVMICIPNSVHALTPKYKGWVEAGTYSYVSSIPSFYIISGMLAIILLFVFQHVKFRKTLLAVFSPVIFVLVLATGVSNNIIAGYFLDRQSDYENLERIIMSDYLNDVVEDNSQIYCDNFIQPYDKGIIELYISSFTGKTVNFVNSEEDIDFSRPVYILHFSSNCNAAVIGKSDEFLSSSEICLILNEKDTISSMSFASNSFEFDAEWKGSGEKVSFNTDYAYLNIPEHDGSEIYLVCDSVIVTECDVYSEKIVENSVHDKLMFSMGTGFSGRETNGATVWNWCGYNGSMTVNNYSADALFTAITFGYGLGSENGELYMNLGNDEIVLTGANGNVTMPVVLPRGKTTINFKYVGDKLNSDSDPRDLCFRIFDIGTIDISNMEFSSLCEGTYYTEQRDPTSFRWNWSDNHSRINIINFCDEAYDIVVDTDIGITESGLFTVTQNAHNIYSCQTYDFMPVKLEIELGPGKNNIEFSTTSNQLHFEGDSRNMYFRFINPKIYSAKQGG